MQEIEGEGGVIPLPLYNLVPPPGTPAQFGFQLAGLPFYIDTEVGPENGYKPVAVQHNLSQAKRPVAATALIWGEPSDPRHDPLRGECLNQLGEGEFPISYCEGGVEPGLPLLRLPSNCESPLDIELNVESWSGFAYGETEEHPAAVGCNAVPFAPALKARPTTDVADSPSGLEADLQIPQPEEPEGRGEADLRKTEIHFPPGLVINPSGANGLGACSEAEVGYQGKAGPQDRFSGAPGQCPDSSRLGSVEVSTPLVAHPLKGSIYAATPYQNPFDSLLATYIVLEDPISGDPSDPATGLVVKLAGEVGADPATGRLTATFAETPQQPFEEFAVKIPGGPKAPLRTPQTCGAYSTDSTITPWSAPESGPPAGWSDNYAISQSPGGGACPTSAGALPNAPSFKAGTEAPLAGAYSPLVLRLHREDGSQDFTGITLTPPPGLTGRLAGVPYCPDARAGERPRRQPGTRRGIDAPPARPLARSARSQSPRAPAPTPSYTSGRVYLAGPYKGAPLSLVVIAPAVAGPFDLGTVVTRVALHVEPDTRPDHAPSPTPPARSSTASRSTPLDRMPRPPRLHAQPDQLRSDAVRWASPPLPRGPDRAALHRFQVGGCQGLAFKPSSPCGSRARSAAARTPPCAPPSGRAEGEANIAEPGCCLPAL